MKQVNGTDYAAYGTVLYYIPLQQGLKLTRYFRIILQCKSSLLYSITTRIETCIGCRSIVVIPGSLLYSITTRIETRPDRFRELRHLSSLLYSITTRIETTVWRCIRGLLQGSLLYSITTRIETPYSATTGTNAKSFFTIFHYDKD